MKGKLTLWFLVGGFLIMLGLYASPASAHSHPCQFIEECDDGEVLLYNPNAFCPYECMEIPAECPLTCRQRPCVPEFMICPLQASTVLACAINIGLANGNPACEDIYFIMSEGE